MTKEQLTIDQKIRLMELAQHLSITANLSEGQLEKLKEIGRSPFEGIYLLLIRLLEL